RSFPNTGGVEPTWAYRRRALEQGFRLYSSERFPVLLLSEQHQYFAIDTGSVTSFERGHTNLFPAFWQSCQQSSGVDQRRRPPHDLELRSVEQPRRPLCVAR